MKKTIQTTNDLGPFIRTAREHKKMTLEVVSSKSGFTCQTISNLEKNRGSVNVNTLLAVATVVGVRVEISFEETMGVMQ
jgi:transcriptional regulator with XRE-family HTH domain